MIAFLLVSGPAAMAGEDAASREMKSLRYIPPDAILASAMRIDSLALVGDAILAFVTPLVPEAQRREMDAFAASWREGAASAVRNGLLAHMVREVAYSVSLESIDGLASGIMAAATEPPGDLAGTLGGFLVVTGVVDPDAFDAGVEALLSDGSVSLERREGGLRAIRVADEEMVLHAYYLHHDGFALWGLSADELRAAVTRAEGKTGLPAAEDFRAVTGRLAPDPESVSYVNFPRIKALLEGSFMLQASLATDPDAASVYRALVRDAEWSRGGVWQTYVVEGGSLRQSFLPGPWGQAMQGISTPGSMAGAGIIAAIAVPNLLNAIDRGKQKRTLADIRVVAQGCEAHRIDMKTYPGPTEGYVDVVWLAARLEQELVRDLPTMDGWGHALRYWSDGRSYVILSTGKDGVREWSEGVTGTTRSFDADIVMIDGEFVQLPAGPQE